ncbi:hypothetical protein ACFL0Y_03740 [Patescibacteria group bacterium]
MKDKALLFVGIILLLLAIGGGAGFYFLGQEESDSTIQPTPLPPLPTPTSSSELTSTQTPPESTIPTSWQTYTNSEHGFEISFPENYQALDDSENLYGWPNGVVLIYGGGQSYDLPIEVWDTTAEYETKYQNQMSSLTVKEVGNKFITLLNQNNIPEVDQIIATFKVLD